MPGPIRDPSEAFQQLEAIMLRQMLQSSGAFRASGSPGAQLRTDMFVETLADAVAKAGGLGIAKMLQHQLGGAPSTTTSPLPSGLSGGPRRPGHDLHGMAPVSRAASPSGAIDDLDDPNSEAPLPEDPGADSIDDYQSRNGERVPAAPRGPSAAIAPHGTSGLAAAAAGEVTGQITSPFGERVHPITGDRRFHTGVDLRAAPGAPIRAAAGGVVIDAGRRGGYGNTVEIDHGNGTSTLYAHASEVLVAKGERVSPGQAVALVGQTGQATGPHLHFEVRRNDHPVNPTAGNAPISLARALNTYRQRVEVSGGGTPFRAGPGDKP